MHTLLELLLVLVTGCLFVLLVRIRPNGTPLGVRKTAGLFVVGLVIGVIFVSTHTLYVKSTGL